MTASPKVSVLIPTYNQCDLLKEAIESVLAQTLTDFELIVNDNASTDGTQQMVQGYFKDSRVRYFRNDSVIAMHENWNKCLDHVQGSYIKYLCSDDKFRPQVLEKMVAVMDQHPDVSIVSCGRAYFGEKQREFVLDWKGKYDGKETILNTLRTYNWLACPSTVMCRMKNFKEQKFRNYKWITDWDMWIRQLALGNYFAIPEILVDERVHNRSVTRNFSLHQIKLSEEYELFRNLRDQNYDISFPGKEAELSLLVQRKVFQCAQYMYSRIPKLTKQKHKDAFRNLLKIVWSEKLVLKSFKMQLKKKLFTKN